MNENDFNKGIEELKNIRLSKAEKESVFKKVMLTPVESPYVKPSPIFVSIFTRHTQVFVAASLVLIMSFGGAIYASDESLPGDALYSVKTAVVEPVLDVVYSAPEKKLVWEEEKVERRIAEAEQLIERGELDEEKLAKLEAKIEKSSITFAATASIVASSTATSSIAKQERERKIKQDFRTKISERRFAFDDEEEEVEDATASLMMSVKVSEEDKVLNELTNDSSRRGKSLNKEKMERLKRAATRNLNGNGDNDDDNNDNNRDDRSSDDNGFVDGVKLRGDGSVDDNDNDSSDDDKEDRDEDSDDRSNKLEIDVEVEIKDIHI